MEVRLLSKGRCQGAPAAVGEQALLERFGVHFPRLFAYAYAYVGGEAAAREIAAEALARALARHPDLPDEEFRLALFGLARRLCRAAACTNAPLGDMLSRREREVLSLVFDAQLRRHEVGALLKLKEDAVTSALVSGLTKLRRRGAAATLAAYLHLS